MDEGKLFFGWLVQGFWLLLVFGLILVLGWFVGLVCSRRVAFLEMKLCLNVPLWRLEGTTWPLFVRDRPERTSNRGLFCSHL